MYVLNVSKLHKQFKEFVAVDHISFNIKPGEVVGLLGPNGAGKTTTIQMLMSITTPTSGAIEYFGKDFASESRWCLQRINFTTAFNSLQGRTTVKENLTVFAGLYEVENSKEKIAHLAKRLEFEDLLDQVYKSLSAGQKTRINIAKALLNDPKLILMDEPTASLDPDIADKVLTFVEELRTEKNTAILFTSHDMDEVARICDRVIFLDHGKIVAEDTPLGLTKRITHATLTLTFDGLQRPIREYLQKNNLQYSFLRRRVVRVELDEDKIPKVIFGLSKVGVYMTDIDIKKPDLEDVFLDIARGGADE